jgi:hypothetical protein
MGWVMGTIDADGRHVITHHRPPVESPQEALQGLTMEFLESISGGPVKDITDQIATEDEN